MQIELRERAVTLTAKEFLRVVKQAMKGETMLEVRFANRVVLYCPVRRERDYYGD